jgi:hypothetical protein
MSESERAKNGPMVRAIAVGYYDGSLRAPESAKTPASVFQLYEEDDFAKNWMEKVGEHKKSHKAHADTDENKRKSTPNAARDADAAKILKAVTDMDPEIDGNWKKNGLVSEKAVSKQLGFDVTSEEIEAVLPNYTRDQARVGAASV